ncbi:MAG: nitrite reductase small subunit [Pyrinomonadaceae bacterium]|jgi:nitrite reductase/ring-hydroxylating ferredoxin subunit|nr:nitrite reductase small subunit [Pyrinomonadaceae bacterium]
MQPFDTDGSQPDEATAPAITIEAGRTIDLPQGTAKTITLSEGRELALYHINGEINGEIHGEFYATENSCPHKGAPLANGLLCEYVIECDWHGWQFDVRTGACLTVPERIETYEVFVEDGVIRIVV